MTHIYHRNTAARTCAEIRSPSTWEWKLGSSKARLDVLAVKSDEVTGYYSLGTDWRHTCAHGISVLTHEACGSIIGSLVGTAEKRGLKDVPLVYLNPLVTGGEGIRELATNSKVWVKGEEQALCIIPVGSEAVFFVSWFIILSSLIALPI